MGEEEQPEGEYAEEGRMSMEGEEKPIEIDQNDVRELEEVQRESEVDDEEEVESQ